jgi:hypothetical protein
MAHICDNLGLHHQSLVASLVSSCCMGQGGTTGERLEMLAVTAGNYTPVEDEIQSEVA